MKRHAVALLVHPFKNRLIPPQQLKTAVDACMRSLLDLAAANQNIRLNIVIPGYIFDMVDTLMLPELRDVQKRGMLEWLVSGYTEPFLSFSPQWLTKENIRASIQTCTEVLGTKPSGYVPPFSNWEPGAIDLLRDLGINHVALSQYLLPPDCRNYCVSWATEHAGTSMVVFPVHTLHPYTAPANLEDWLENQFSQDTQAITPLKILGIHYLVPLDTQTTADPFAWLKAAARTFDNLALKYQMVRFSEYLSGNVPFGLQYLPSGLVFSQSRLDIANSFWNWLFTYDQVGIMHRRLMEICDTIEPHALSRAYSRQVKRLFFAQDINRYLPGTASGFEHCDDRSWLYRTIIDIEKTLPKSQAPKGGQIRIADHLRTGTKSIIMANAGLKVYIDHRCGGTVFELDLEEQRMNVCAGYNPRRNEVPGVVMPGKSRTAFIDHLLLNEATHIDFMNGAHTELGDFVRGRFDYNVKKSSSSVKAVLNRQGALLQGDKTCPLYMEKVFALEKDTADLSFVYQLSNRSLTPYSFTFATELTLVLPGASRGLARAGCGKNVWKNLALDRLYQQDVTEFVLEDNTLGLKITIQIQKPVTVWCFPVGQPTGDNPAYHGTTIVLSAPVSLTESSSWTLMGKLSFKAVRTQGEEADAI